MDVASLWEKAQERPGRKKIWNIQESPELNVATSCGHSALKSLKERVRVCAHMCICVCMCMHVRVCMCVCVYMYMHMCAGMCVCVCLRVHVGLCQSPCLKQDLMTPSLTWSGFPALSFLLRSEHAGSSGEENGNYAQ